MIARTHLLCRIAQVKGVPAGASNLDVDDLSLSGTIILNWTNPTPQSTTTEVWKSTDGITFVLFTTIAGNFTTVHDTTGMPNNSMWFYKVRSCSGSTCSAFSNTVSVSNEFNLPAFQAVISYPTLIKAFGSINGAFINVVTFSVPLLRSVENTLDLSNDAALTNLNFNSLVQVGNNFFLGSSNPAAINLPKLLTVGANGNNGDFQTQDNNACTTLSAPLLVSVSNNFVLSNMPLLTSVNLTSLQFVGEDGLNGRLDFQSDIALTSISFPALLQVRTEIDFTLCTALTSIQMPVLNAIDGVSNIFAIDGTGCTNLVTFNIPVLTFVSDGFIVNVANAKLNAASVNQVLAAGVASGWTSTDVELAGGTNAAPSGQGIADKATLIGNGCTVNTN